MGSTRLLGRTCGTSALFLVTCVLGACALGACASQANDDSIPLSDGGRTDGTVDGGRTDGSPQRGDGGSQDGSQGIDSSAGDSGNVDNDSGQVDTDSGSVQSDSGSSDTGSAVESGIADSGGAGDCGSFPTLHPGNGTTLFCPFGPDAGAPIDCVVKQQLCCISGKVGSTFPPSDCEPISQGTCAAVEAGIAGSTQIECEDPATDCPSGSTCCGAPNSIQPVVGCGYDKLVGFQYTRCESGGTCAAGEFQLCESLQECPSGQTCTVFKAKGMQLGFCQ